MPVEAHEFSLHFVEKGHGQPLLLIHGFPFNAMMWQPQLDGLGTVARMLAPDLPGFGDSPAPDGPASMHGYAEDCVAVLDALDILEPVVVAGLSMGGYVALALARHFSERVGGLVLASTRMSADSPDGKANRDKTISKVEAEGVETLVADTHPKLLAPQTYTEQPKVAQKLKQIMLASSAAGAVAALAAMRDRPDSTGVLAALEVPVLIVHGEADGVIPPSEAQAMAAAQPAAQLTLIADAGHLPNLEQPQAFNRILTEFLEKF